jgi:quercetin dioxygenase-like cupin family protein
MFYKKGQTEFKEPSPGIRFKTLTFGDQTQMLQFHLAQGSELAEHSHPQEQIGYLLSGKIEFIINGERQIAEPGDSWCIQGNVPHYAKALEDSDVIEVFHPQREDLK